MCILILFVSAWVLSEGVLSLWVSLNKTEIFTNQYFLALLTQQFIKVQFSYKKPMCTKSIGLAYFIYFYELHRGMPQKNSLNHLLKNKLLQCVRIRVYTTYNSYWLIFYLKILEHVLAETFRLNKTVH